MFTRLAICLLAVTFFGAEAYSNKSRPAPKPGAGKSRPADRATRPARTRQDGVKARRAVEQNRAKTRRRNTENKKTADVLQFRGKDQRKGVARTSVAEEGLRSNNRVQEILAAKGRNGRTVGQVAPAELRVELEKMGPRALQFFSTVIGGMARMESGRAGSFVSVTSQRGSKAVTTVAKLWNHIRTFHGKYPVVSPESKLDQLVDITTIEATVNTRGEAVDVYNAINERWIQILGSKGAISNGELAALGMSRAEYNKIWMAGVPRAEAAEKVLYLVLVEKYGKTFEEARKIAEESKRCLI